MIRGKYMDSPIGRLYLAEEAGCIVRLSRGGTGIETAGDVPEALARAEAEVTEYLKGMRRQFTVPVKPSGTPFQERVWKVLGQIPYGQTMSYGQVAEAVGCPRGARAVGMACNRNPILLLIPCHRVVGRDGKLVGFGAGLEIKELLLRLERGGDTPDKPQTGTERKERMQSR